MPLPNGNFLLFDNGPHRLDHTMPFSRIIEVDLATKQIVWKYQEKRESDFFSPRISNAQRLPNGNTLICEGDFGRLVRAAEAGMQANVERQPGHLEAEQPGLLPTEVRQRHRPSRVAVHAPLVVQQGVRVPREDEQPQRKLSRIVSISSSS